MATVIYTYHSCFDIQVIIITSQLAVYHQKSLWLLKATRDVVRSTMYTNLSE